MARRARYGCLAAAVATTVAVTAAPPAFAQNTATLPGGSSQAHYTFGGGPRADPLAGTNAAADLASKTKYVTFSVVIRSDTRAVLTSS
jgi:hypothetical protein